MKAAGALRDEVLAWRQKASDLALMFESRWTWAALRRVAPEIHRKLIEQRSRFDEIAVDGQLSQVEVHGGSLCRGYLAAIKAMEAAPDDAYSVGKDQSGLVVAIGEKSSAGRVRELYGDGAVSMTPDEVAALVANLGQIKHVLDIKRMFPGAEIMEIRKSI